MKIALVLASIILLGAQSVQAAGSWQTRQYDARYSYSSKQGNGEYRMASDGKGHALIESNIGNITSTMIVDRPNKTCYSITMMPGGQRMAMKTPYTEQSTAGSTAEEMKKYNGKQIGARVVEGRPCHGWQYAVSGSNTESWIGDDIDFMVRSTTSNPQTGATTMVLKSFTPTAPAAAAFTLPAGVKVMDMSNPSAMTGNH